MKTKSGWNGLMLYSTTKFSLKRKEPTSQTLWCDASCKVIIFKGEVYLLQYILTDLFCKFRGRISNFRRDFTFQQTFSTKLDRVKTFSTSFHPEHREGWKLVEKVETLSSFVEKFSCKVKSWLKCFNPLVPRVRKMKMCKLACTRLQNLQI